MKLSVTLLTVLLFAMSYVAEPARIVADATSRVAGQPELVSTNPIISVRPVAAPLPPLGWNSWNSFYKNPTEKAVREIADAMVSSGMKDAGYEYVVIDDFWEYGHVPKPGREVNSRPGRDAQGLSLIHI